MKQSPALPPWMALLSSPGMTDRSPSVAAPSRGADDAPPDRFDALVREVFAGSTPKPAVAPEASRPTAGDDEADPMDAGAWSLPGNVLPLPSQEPLPGGAAPGPEQQMFGQSEGSDPFRLLSAVPSAPAPAAAGGAAMPVSAATPPHPGVPSLHAVPNAAPVAPAPVTDRAASTLRLASPVADAVLADVHPTPGAVVSGDAAGAAATPPRAFLPVDAAGAEAAPPRSFEVPPPRAAAPMEGTQPMWSVESAAHRPVSTAANHGASAPSDMHPHFGLAQAMPEGRPGGQYLTPGADGSHLAFEPQPADPAGDAPDASDKPDAASSDASEAPAEPPSSFRVVSRLGPEGHYGAHRGGHHTADASIPPPSQAWEAPSDGSPDLFDLGALHREAVASISDGEVTVRVDDDVSVDVQVDGDTVNVVVETSEAAAHDFDGLRHELADQLAQGGQDLGSYERRTRDDASDTDPAASRSGRDQGTAAEGEEAPSSAPVARGRLVNTIV